MGWRQIHGRHPRMPALNDPRWEAACQERAQGGDVKASYRAAGFSGNPAAASKFFGKPHIKKRVDEIVEQRYSAEHKARDIATKKAGLEESWIIERTKYVAEIAIRGTPILDDAGRPTGGFSGKPQLKAAVDALRLLSDFKGMRIHRLEVGGPGDFARMSDEELDSALIEQGKALGIPEEALLMITGPQAGPEE